MSKSELWFIRIELEDWRQYLGKHEIAFSTDPQKHLTIIHAENSVGKTTMLNAIKFVLYGVTPEFKDKKTLVCDRSNKTTCRVRLNFKYGETEYTALRTYDQRTQQSALTLHEIKKPSGAQELVVSADAVINNIMPSELSNYFLFAGERYSQALDAYDNTSHHRAIRDILGFTLSETVIADIESLKTKYTRKLSDLLKKNTETENLGTELERLQKYEVQYKDLILASNIELKKQIGIKEANDDLIKNSNHSKATELARAQTAQEGELKRTKENRIDYLKQRQKLISSYGWILFGSKLTKKNFDHIKVNHGDIPSPHRENVITKIIADKRCICTTPVLPDSKERKALQKLLDESSNEIIDNRVIDAISQGDYFRKRSVSFLTDLKNIEVNLQKFNTQIGSLEQNLEQLSKNIKSIGNVDIKKFQEKRDAAAKAILKITGETAVFKSDMGSNNNSIKSIERQIALVRTNTSENIKLQKFIDLSDEVVNKLKKTLKIHEEGSLRDIKKLVQINVDQSLRKKREVVLTHDYKFELKDPDTGRVDMGSDGGNGQTLLSNLSFITALISVSKNRALTKQSAIFVPGTIAPFVMDAPFAEMDKTYIEKVLNFLPGQSHQLIVFLSSKQWEDTYENIIGKFIGKRYIFINHDMTINPTKSSLTIKNKTYELNIENIDNKISATTIEEI